MTDTMKHFEQQTLFNSCLPCILFIQNEVPYFKAVTDSNLTRLLPRKKKKTVKKPHLGQVFQSVTSFET